MENDEKIDIFPLSKRGHEDSRALVACSKQLRQLNDQQEADARNRLLKRPQPSPYSQNTQSKSLKQVAKYDNKLQTGYHNTGLSLYQQDLKIKLGKMGDDILYHPTTTVKDHILNDDDDDDDEDDDGLTTTTTTTTIDQVYNDESPTLSLSLSTDIEYS